MKTVVIGISYSESFTVSTLVARSDSEEYDTETLLLLLAEEKGVEASDFDELLFVEGTKVTSKRIPW